MSDIAIAIDAEARNVTHTKRAEGSYDDGGSWVPGADTTAIIRAAIFPATGDRLSDLPDGIRTEAGWLLWSRTPITVNDEITDRNVTYRVLFAWDRSEEGGFHRAALGRKAP